MNKSRFIITLLQIIFLLAGSSIANTLAANDEKEFSVLSEGLSKTISPKVASKDSGKSILPDVLCSDIKHKVTIDVCWRAYQSSLNYYEVGLRHRTKVFWWQHVTTRIIFFVVLLLVCVGIYFAWVQFRIEIGDENNKKISNENNDHKLELSTSGIKVSSPVLGVIILALSLAFFYLYLIYVYPISEIF